jgi:hypothetical protein
VAPIKLTHDETVDALVRRLEGKHDYVKAHKLYHSNSRCIGEMDVVTMDRHKDKTYVHYFEVKTGDLQHARRKARGQAANFFDHYTNKPSHVPTFIFYHPEVGFERWKR